MTSISVITVCWNAAATIEQTLQSVVGQTHPHIEYLVIDGASTDATLELIERYRSGIDVLVSEPDDGLYNAMNKGIEAATGDALIFLNADDRFHDPEVVADMAWFFDQDADLELIYGEVLMEQDGELKDGWRQLPVADRQGLCKTTISHQSQFSRASLFKRTGGFDEQYRAVADYDWLYRAVVDHGAKTRHIDRLVSIVGTEGLTCATQAWKKERQAVHRKFYSPAELFRWRVIPRYIVPRLARARQVIHQFRCRAFAVLGHLLGRARS